MAISDRNIFQENWITLRDVPDMIRLCQFIKRSLMIFGGAGLGKSQVVKQAANMIFGERDDNLVDFRLADKEPSDVVGLQIPYTDPDGVTRTVYAVPDFWPRDPDWKGIVFLDELLHAEPYLQKVAFQIMLDRRIGSYKFPDGAILVGAGNRSGDGTAVTAMEAPLANRMILVELQYDASIFIEDYAIPNDVSTSVISFIGAKPEAIENYEAMVEEGCPSYATPRSWVTVSDIIKVYDKGGLSARLAQAAIQGSIGTSLAREFWHHHTKLRNLTPIVDIMDGKATKYTGHDSADMLWIIGSQGVMWLRKAVNETTYTDDQVVTYSANFLSYMYDNFSKRNGDFVTSIFLSFIRPTAFGPAILIDGPREKLPTMLLQKYPVVMKIIQEYQANYSEAVKEAEKAK